MTLKVNIKSKKVYDDKKEFDSNFLLLKRQSISLQMFLELKQYLIFIHNETIVSQASRVALNVDFTTALEMYITIHTFDNKCSNSSLEV